MILRSPFLKNHHVFVFSGNVERVGELESQSGAAANGNVRSCASSSGIRIKTETGFNHTDKSNVCFII